MKKIIILLIILAIITATFAFVTENNEKQNQDVNITVKSQETEPIIFYEDSCSDCRKVYFIFYIANQINPKIKLVNLNSTLNKRYISMFRLTQVPTICFKNEKYSGTNIKKIWNLLFKNIDLSL